VENYTKILNGEIDIKYLSPPDLIDLIRYLEKENITLEEVMKKSKSNNERLKKEKEDLQIEIYGTKLEEDII